MKKRNIILGLFLSLGLIVAGVSISLTKSNYKTFEVKADATPNNMFGYIYSDDYNNQGNGLTLFVFEGTATGLSENYNFTETNKVKVNGVGLDVLGGTVGMWSGKNWMQVTYPTTSAYEGATLEIESGLTAGDAIFSGCKFVMNSNLKWEFDGFNDLVTSTFASTPYAESYNISTQLLIQYNGNAIPVDYVTNAKDIHNYDDYVTINGVPFSSISGAEIRSWKGQKWLWLRFPAASKGDVLRIESGMRFYSEVFETMNFVFNGTSWERKALVTDDSDVANSDYKIFTINDYNFAVNDEAGFIFFSSSDYVDSMSGSFCFQTNVNKSDLATYMSMKFAGTDIFGANAIIKIEINFNSNAYLTFNGSIDWTTNISPIWETGVNYLVEVYTIRTSSTSLVVLLARDGEIIWKSAVQDITGLTFNNYFTTTGTANTASEYTSVASTVSTALNRFNAKRLENPVGATALEKYEFVKAYYDTYLTSNQKNALANDATYVDIKDAYASLEANALLEYKTSKKEELNNYVNEEDYFASDWQEIQAIMTNGCSTIDEATSFDAVNEILANAKTAIDEYKTIAQQIVDAKTAANNELDAIDLTVYRAEQKATVEGLIASGKEAINAATTLEAIATQLASTKASIGEIPTDAEMTAQEHADAAIVKIDAIGEVVYTTESKALIDDARTSYNNLTDGEKALVPETKLNTLIAAENRYDELKTEAELASSQEAACAELDAIDLTIYRDEQKATVESLIASGKEAINSATTLEGVATQLANTKALIAEVKTAEQMELDEAKASAKAELDLVNPIDYREGTDRDTIIQLVSNGKIAIDNCDSKQAVETTLSNVKADISNIKTDAQKTAEELAQHKEEVKTAIDEMVEDIIDNYREAEQTLITESASETKAAIDEAANISAVDALKSEFESAVEQIKTAAQLNQEEAVVVMTAINNIPDITITNYLECEEMVNSAKAQFNALNDDAKALVMNFDILNILENRILELKQEKTDADAVDAKISQIGNVDASQASLTKINDARSAYNALNEETKQMVSNLAALEAAESVFSQALNNAKQGGKSRIDEYYSSLNLDKYSKENQELISQYVQEAKENIDKITCNDNIENIVSSFIKNVDKVEQKPASGGCGGSIAMTSALLSSLALVGCVLLLNKRRKN